MKLILVFFILLVNSDLGYAENQRYPFDSPDLEQHFQDLTEELRCLVCQNQSLADSDAALANDLRQEIYTMMKNGKSESQIKDFLIERYGDFILYRPPVNSKTWFLWLGPLLLIMAGSFTVLYLIKRKNDPIVITESELQDIRKSLEEGRST